MVDADLQDATDELVGEVVQFDVVSLIVGLGSLLVGLFTGEVIGQLARSTLSGQRTIVQTVGDLAARLGLAGLAVVLRGMVGGMTVDIVLGMVAVGIVAGAVGQVIEGAAEVLADILEGSPVGSQQEESTSTDLGDSGYGADAGSAGSPDTPDIEV